MLYVRAGITTLGDHTDAAALTGTLRGTYWHRAYWHAEHVSICLLVLR